MNLEIAGAAWRYLVYSGCLLASGCVTNAPIALKSEESGVVQVKTVMVQATAVDRTTLQPASVHSYYRAELRAKASGFVSQLQTDIGDTVEAGAVLAIIDVPEMQEQRHIIEARIRRLEAEEKRAIAGIELATARVASAAAKLAEAQARLASVDAFLAAAEAEFDRTQDLVLSGSLQDRRLDEVRMRRDSETARQDASLSSIKYSQAEVGVARAELVSAQADLDAARAETQIARSQLAELDVRIDYATVQAPFAGIVTERNIDPGDLVRKASEGAAGKPLFVINQVDRVRVRIPIPESDAPLVQPGDEVTLTFPSFSAEPPIKASITRRSGSLDPSTRTMLVEVELDNADGKLLPGMFGQAKIQMAANGATNMLPSQAIRFDQSGKAFVYVVENESVSVQQIETGTDNGVSIEVVSGLQAGQHVVGPHLKRFSEGQRVALLESSN